MISENQKNKWLTEFNNLALTIPKIEDDYAGCVIGIGKLKEFFAKVYEEGYKEGYKNGCEDGTKNYEKKLFRKN
jgi:flagellar biosynthesis/type III secretory pathway protein FliH